MNASTVPAASSSPSGWLVFLLLVSLNSFLFSKTPFASLLSSPSLPSPLLFVAQLVCACLNCLSHFAVVGGLLNDTLIFSILLGVGFDVLSTLLYIFLWLRLALAFRSSITSSLLNSSTGFPPWTPTFLGVLVSLISYNLYRHIRALRMSRSLPLLTSVVHSASNNLRGIPGPMHADHLFAFSDLSLHFSHALLSCVFLGAKRGAATVGALVVVGVWVRAVQVWMQRRDPPRWVFGVEGEVPEDGLLKVEKDGRMVCRCGVCMGKTAFRVDVGKWRVCRMWMCSFEQMCGITERMGGEKEKAD